MTDRKLDKQLAEHLWGCKPEDFDPIYHDHTADWNGVGMMMDKARERGWLISVEDTLDKPERRFYAFAKKPQTDEKHIRYGPTGPIAVALVILGALGVEVGHESN